MIIHPGKEHLGLFGGGSNLHDVVFKVPRVGCSLFHAAVSFLFAELLCVYALKGTFDAPKMIPAISEIKVSSAHGFGYMLCYQLLDDSSYV